MTGFVNSVKPGDGIDTDKDKTEGKDKSGTDVASDPQQETAKPTIVEGSYGSNDRRGSDWEEMAR